jgi:hypothetical protein
VNNIRNKNQKNKEEFFIFLIKKTMALRLFKYLKKIPVQDAIGPISRGLKHHNWQGVSQYLWWVL